jgi:hypothetical protein
VETADADGLAHAVEEARLRRGGGADFADAARRSERVSSESRI